MCAGHPLQMLRISVCLLLCCLGASAQVQRPSAAYAPLFTGLIRFTDVPAYGTPEAPPIIQPTGRKRRNDNYPAAPELSSPVLERLYSGEYGSTRQRRLLQQQQQQQQQQQGEDSLPGSTHHLHSQFDYAAAFAPSYGGGLAATQQQARRRRNMHTNPAGINSSHVSSGQDGRRKLLQHFSSGSSSEQGEAHFDYAAAFASSYAADDTGAVAAAPEVDRRRRAGHHTTSQAASLGTSLTDSSDASIPGRRLQEQKPFDYAAAFAASYATADAAAASATTTSSSGNSRAAARRAARAAAAAAPSSSSSSSQAGRKLQQHPDQEQAQKPFDYAAAFAASYTAAAAVPAVTNSSRAASRRAARARAAAPGEAGHRRLQQQKPFDYAAAFAASYAQPMATTDAAGISTQRRAVRRRAARASVSTSGRKLQQEHQHNSRAFDYAAAFAASYAPAAPAAEGGAAAAAAAPGTPSPGQQHRRRARRAHTGSPAANSTSSNSNIDSSSSSSDSGGNNRKLQQAAKQRPGWTGLWWADAGGVGVAAGPSHLVHTISTVIAVYSLDPDTGVQVGEPRVVALQDLFAPVGAANCKEGVYDAVPLYDKAAKRYIVAATCGGKGAALLAATATSDPTGPWFLFMLLADAAETGMGCSNPKETALADAVRVTYDGNGVYLSLFNYCPSNPATQGATIMALPKHKVYKGAPNFVYAVFSADQILAALPGEQRRGLAAANFKQCGAAPPQWDADAAGNAAYFVCDQAGPDVSPRGNFTLLAIVNTGALWQFVGTRPSSPTPFMAARLVDRGGDAPLRSAALLQQPERGSFLQAGGTKPTGFWSGAAVLAGGKVYAVDRIDVTHTPEPPGVPVTLPSLMWSEVTVQVSMSGAGDCTKTSAWGSNWDWAKDWSVDWGKDFDKEWKDNKNDADSMKDRVEDLEDAIRKSANCTAPEQQQSQGLTQVSDGSAATTDGKAGSNCTMSAVNGTDLGLNAADGGAAALPTGGGRKLASRTGGTLMPLASSISSSSSSPVTAAWLAAKAAAQCSRPATELMLQPLQFAQDDSEPSLLPNWPWPWEASSGSSGQLLDQFAPIAADVDIAAAAAAAESWEADDSYDDIFLSDDYSDGGIGDEPQQWDVQEGGDEGLLPGDGSDWGEDVTGSGASRRLSQATTIGGYIGFDMGCWYCYYGKGFYYSSSWFYKYWYSRNAWGFGWYRRYKRNYAPGWSRPSKFIGHRRHMLTSEQQHMQSLSPQQQQQQQQQQGVTVGSAALGGVRRRLVQAEAAPVLPPTQLQNETIMVPPCLLSSTYYKNTCKQCNYSHVTVKVTIIPTRRGLLNATSSDNPLGFVAPMLVVTLDGSVVVIAGYAGPNNHPNSSAPAYPGVGSFTIPPGAQGLNATWKVLRTGVGKVKSPTGRWSDFSTASVAVTASPNPVPGQPDLAGVRVHYGVQWAQREVECAEDELQGDFEFEPVCAMPAPWIGVLAA